MKHNFFPFLLAVILLTACENKIDDRERPVPQNPQIAWLLSVQLTKIPQAGLYYSFAEINTANPQPQYMHVFATNTTISSKDLPILWKIDGGQRLDKEDEIHAFSILSIDPLTETPTPLLIQPIPTLDQLKAYPISKKDTVSYPTKIRYEENGVACTLIFRYD